MLYAARRFRYKCQKTIEGEEASNEKGMGLGTPAYQRAIETVRRLTMKKLVIFMICFVLSASLTGCKKPVSGNESGSSNDVIRWFDYLNGDELVFDDVKEYRFDEFPGVTFQWNYGSLEAVTEEETITLYTGMPIWSVYFYDLTGDGNPELCSTLSMGSGVIDNRIIIYDYAGGASYELSDRGNFDYVLNMQGDSLVVEKRPDGEDELIGSGELVFLNDTIQINY